MKTMNAPPAKDHQDSLDAVEGVPGEAVSFISGVINCSG
jgi:hypothetical protein